MGTRARCQNKELAYGAHATAARFFELFRLDDITNSSASKLKKLLQRATNLCIFNSFLLSFLLFFGSISCGIFTKPNQQLQLPCIIYF
mmetsp:Transcript_17002/g.42462  ORF Transcript_17002/g.42462 Transcript_17002/m.42462 type:complete len:88 (+) Transcript_17002:230-493(+)